MSLGCMRLVIICLKWSPRVFEICARKFGLVISPQVFTYAHENGCPWDETTCSNAAKFGHLECLKYAHENGCPWDETTCFNAAENDHPESFKYAVENGCPQSTNTEYNVWA